MEIKRQRRVLKMKNPERRVRDAAVAGKFYPEDREGVINFIRYAAMAKAETMNRVRKIAREEKVSGIIVPHAGWIYSGKTAITTYPLLEEKQPAKIALLGPSHHFPINRIFADGHSYWDTPIGLIKLFKDNFFDDNTTYHAPEHSLEVQLPFIKYYSGDSALLPLLTGQISREEAFHCAGHLAEHGYFVIISTDLSHYHSLEEAKKRDKRTITNIENLNLTNIDACGSNPLKVAAAYCRIKGTHPHLIDYSTSAETSGDTGHVVGYAAFWF